jgi:hypothetical protein
VADRDRQEPDEGQDPGPIEIGTVANIAPPNDPGPIEIGLVMKSANPAPVDLEHRLDLNIGEVGGQQDDGSSDGS